MKRPKEVITLSGIMFAWVSLGVLATAGAQTESKLGRARAPAVPDQTVAADSRAPVGLPLTDRPIDEKAITAVGETFRRAFNAGDAKSVAALFSDDAEMIDEYGERVQGRPSIQGLYAAIFEERKGATIEISRSLLRFLAADVAKEEGQTRVKPASA